MAALSAALDMKPYLHAADINDNAYVFFFCLIKTTKHNQPTKKSQKK